MAFDPTKVDAARALERADRRPLPAATFKKPAGEFKKGLRAGARELGSIGEGVAGAFNELVGRPEAAQENLERSNQLVQDAAAVGPRVKKVEEIESATDLKDWVAGTFGRVLPVMAPMAIGGPAGVAGKALTRSAVSNRAAAIGGAVVGSAGTETGLIFNDLQNTDSEFSGRQKALTALGFGTAAGALDVLPVVQVFNKFGVGKAGKRVLQKSITKDIAKGAGQSAVLEGTTEGVQTLLERAAVNFADEHHEILGDEGMSELVNAIAAGFVVGGGFGGAGSGVASVLSTAPPTGGQPKSVDSAPGQGIFSRMENKLADLEADEELLGAGARSTIGKVRRRLAGLGRTSMAEEIDQLVSAQAGGTTEDTVKFSQDLSAYRSVLDVLEEMTPEHEQTIPDDSINKVAAFINAPTDVGYNLVRADAELLFGRGAKKKIAAIREKLIGVKKKDALALTGQQEDTHLSRAEVVGEALSKTNEEGKASGEVGFEVDTSKAPKFIHKRTKDGLELSKVSDLHTEGTARSAIRELVGEIPVLEEDGSPKLNKKGKPVLENIVVGKPIQEKNGPNVYTIVPAREGILERNKSAGGTILDPAVGEGKFIVRQEQTAVTEAADPERQLTKADMDIATPEQIGFGNVVHRNKLLRRFTDKKKIETPTAHFQLDKSLFVNIPSLTKRMLQKAGNSSVSNTALAESFLNGFLSLNLDQGHSIKSLSKQLNKDTIIFYRGKDNTKPVHFGQISNQIKNSFRSLSRTKDLSFIDDKLREQFGAEVDLNEDLAPSKDDFVKSGFDETLDQPIGSRHPRPITAREVSESQSVNKATGKPDPEAVAKAKKRRERKKNPKLSGKSPTFTVRKQGKHRGRVNQLFNEATKVLGLKNMELLDTRQAKQWAFETKQPKKLRDKLDRGSIHGFNVGNVVYVNPLLSEREQFSTIAHELGHVIHKQMFSKLDKKGPTYNAIMDEYFKWANIAKDQTLTEALRSRGSIHFKINDAWKAQGKGSVMVKDLPPAEAKYVLDFEEWFADQMSVYFRNENAKPANKNQAAIKKYALRLKEFLTNLVKSIDPKSAVQTQRFFAAVVTARQSRGYRAQVSEVVDGIPDFKFAGEPTTPTRKKTKQPQTKEPIKDIKFSRTPTTKRKYGEFLKPFSFKNVPWFQEEIKDPLIKKFLRALDKSTRAEFIGSFDTFSAAEQKAVQSDQREFSRLRGYTKQELADYAETGRLHQLVEDKYGGVEGDLDFTISLTRAYQVAVNMDAVNEKFLTPVNKDIKFSRKINTSGNRGKKANNILLTQQMQQDPYSIESLSHVADFLSEQLTTQEQSALNRALSRNATRQKIEEITDSAGLPLDLYHAIAFQLWMDNKLFIGPETRGIFHKVMDAIRKVLGVPSADHQARAILIAVANAGITNSSRSFNLADVGKNKLHKTRAANVVFDIMNRTTPIIKTLGFTADTNMRNKNPIFTTIANLFHARVGLEGVHGTYFEERTQVHARFNDILQFALEDLTDADIAKVFKAAQSNYDTTGLSAKQKRALKRIRGLFKEASKYLHEAGVLKKELKDTYFPRIYNYDYMRNHKKEFVQMLNNKYLWKMKEYANALHKLEVKHYGANNATSVAQLQATMAERVYGWIMANDGSIENVITTSPQITVEAGFMNMRKFRWLNDADIQPFMSTDYNYIMSTYIDKAVKTAAFRRRVGPGQINQIIDSARKLGATEEDMEQALDAVNAMIGRAGLKTNSALHRIFNRVAPPGQVINPHLQKAMSAIIVARNLMVLGLATFTSLVDPLGILVRSGDFDTAWQSLKTGGGEIRQAVKNLGKAEKQKTEATLLAQTLGTIDIYTTQAALEWEYGGTYMSGTMKRINEGFFKAIGLTQWTQLTRTMATTGAIDFIKKHSDGDYNKQSMRYLRQLNLVPQDIKLDENGQLVLLTHEGLLNATKAERSRDARVKNAINRFVDESILRPNAAQRPIWASDPHWMLLFHLQAFMYSFHDRILRRVYTEYVDHKNITPALMLMTFPMMMLAVNDLRDKIKYLGEDNPRKANWEFYDHFFEAMDRSGIPGVAGTMILSAKTDIDYGGFGFESRLGAVGATTKNILRGRPLVNDVTNLLPGNNVWKNWEVS